MNNRALQVSVALLFAMVVAACGPSPESCEYWKDKLQKMDKLDKAVREVGDKKCKGVFKELEKVWDTGRIRDRVLQAVKKINDPKGAEALIIKALGDTRSGAIAAYLVRDWKIKAAEPALKKVVRNDGAEPFVKAANLKALLSFGKKEHEDFLLEVLKTNPDQQGIALNRIAAQALGEIRSVKAVPYLINALYMEQGKQNAYGEASLALVRMSKEAAPMLIKSLEGKNEILNAYAKKNRLYDFVVTWKLIVMARDMKRKEFGPYLFKYLTKRLKVDSSLPTKEQATQEQVWLSTLTAAAVGLAYLGDTSYVEKLKEVMKDKDYGPRIKMQTIVALTHLAGPASVEFLAGLIRDMRDKNPKKDRRFRTLRYNYFGPLAKIADVDGAKIARKLMQEEADKEVKRGMLLSEPLLEVAEFCKTQIDCWKRMLYFDVDVERANCRKDEKQCPTKILVPQKIMMQAKAMFIERGKKCAKDRGCWTKVYDDLVASTAFSRGMSRFKKRLAALKKGKDALSDRAQKTLSTSLERLPVQVRMTRKDKLEFRQQIREKAALILAFNKNHEPSVQALRGFLSNKDANVRDMVLFALERQADKGAIPLLAEQIKKEKGKADLEYIGDRMQLTIERLKTGNGTVQQAPKTNDETPKKDDDAPKKKKKRKRRKKKR